MAKRSMSQAIRSKSKSAYPTNGTKPGTLRAILDGRKFVPIGKSDAEYDRQIDGGYRGRACPTCFVKFSKTGKCNCS